MTPTDTYYVIIRKGTYSLLKNISEMYDLAIFTAAIKQYADPIIDYIENKLQKKVFKYRYYRSHCNYSPATGHYTKPLKIFKEYKIN